MSSEKDREEERPRSLPVVGIIIAFVLVGITIADFIDDGHISEYLIGADLVLALAFSGYRIDTWADKFIRK